ncbi:MAG: hypothetical protein AB8G99_16775 [Planctomycetaceae bacterium]
MNWIFTADKQRRHVARLKSGTTIRKHPATFQKVKPATNLANGVFGTKQWMAKTPNGTKRSRGTGIVSTPSDLWRSGSSSFLSHHCSTQQLLYSRPNFAVGVPSEASTVHVSVSETPRLCNR